MVIVGSEDMKNLTGKKFLTANKTVRICKVEIPCASVPSHVTNYSNDEFKLFCTKLLISGCSMKGLLNDYQRISIRMKFPGTSNTISISIEGSGFVNILASERLASLETSVNKLMRKKEAILTATQGSNNSGQSTSTIPFNETDPDKIIQHYFQQSEQIDTAFYTHSFKGHWIGYMVQALPGADVGEVEKIISNLKSSHSEGHWQQFEEDWLFLTNFFFTTECYCTKEMYGQLLLSWSHTDLIESIENRRSEEMVCTSCGKKYHYTPEELSLLLGRGSITYERNI